MDHAEVAKRLLTFKIWPNSRYGVNLNPRTTLMTTAIVWGFVIWCFVAPEASQKALSAAQDTITEKFTWFYVGTKNAWVIFIGVIYFSRYGSMKLGRPDEKPEYSTVTWFMMLFACGTGNEMFYYGVAEPIYHYALSAKEDEANRYSHMTPDERAQWAVGLSFFHEGFHGWVVYTVVGLAVAFAGFRLGLPLTIRSCLYALLGNKVFGIVGDLVDTLSAVCTLIGMCVTLGLGVVDINGSIARLSGCPSYHSKDACKARAGCEWQDLGLCKQKCEYITNKAECIGNLTCLYDGENAGIDGYPACQTDPSNDAYVGWGATRDNQIIIVVVITLIATVSVLTGMKVGIRLLSEVCFITGNFLWTYVFVSGNAWYFLDVFVQQLGMYFQWLLETGSHTDAFVRHTVPVEHTLAGAVHIAHNATASLSRDLTLSHDASAASSWMNSWTVFFWGWWAAWSPFVGLFIAKISRGRTVREFINGTMLAPMLYTFAWFNVFGAAGIKLDRLAENAGLRGYESPAYLEMVDGTVNISMPCNSSSTLSDGADCVYVSRLAERPHVQMWMDTVQQYDELGPAVMYISLLAIVLYFVTSSDSGSMVMDCLCSNGNDDSPVPQKVYWSFTEGICAVVLVYIGLTSDHTEEKHVPENNSLKALESVAICTGLPYTILLCFVCCSLWKGLQYEYGCMEWSSERFFYTDLTDVLDISITSKWVRTFGRTLLAVIAPTYFLRTALSQTDRGKKRQIVFLIAITLLFYLAVIFVCLGMSLGWWWYACFVCMLCSLRNELRTARKIDGNVFEDLFACMCVYFLVVDQLDEQFSSFRHYEAKSDGHVAIESDSGCIGEVDCGDEEHEKDLKTDSRCWETTDVTV